ncbi:MAG: sel1 repeat family protein [Betaproteobacteria bacterium]|nr:sel1 repeat family protein [Betaproteobacteria bacterium]
MTNIPPRDSAVHSHLKTARVPIAFLAAIAAWVFVSAAAFGQELLAPAASTKESRAKDMWRCLSVAQGQVGRQDSYSLLGIFDDLKKYVLKDRNTGGFVYTTMLSARSSPVANEDGYPVRRETLFGSSSSDDVSDRYVMCLLSGGYRWKDSPKTFFEEVHDLANQGVPEAQALLAMLYRSYSSGAGRVDYNEFADLTRKAAEKGYAVAQFNLSYAYALGDGVERNEEQALHWMVMAAKNGYARAQPILQRQEGIQADLRSRRQDEAGFAADQRAAQAGDAKAQFALATRFEDGRGVDRSMAQAIPWYRKSADAGLVEAQAYLGVIYDKGRGTKQDDVEAANWYRKAAEQGHGQSQYNLGVFYFYGRAFPANKDEARKWFERSRNSGFPGGATALKEFF